MVHINVEPGTIPMSWKKYVRKKRERSIALDGYVREGPKFDPRGPWANFNHHDGVSRLETRATCAQVLMALRQGMADAFRDGIGDFDVSLDVNDCDEDVCLSVAILRNHVLAIGTMNPLLNKLVFIEDMLDTTAGAYPFPKDLESLREVMWVFNPYHRFRASGRIDTRIAEEFRNIIDDVDLRVRAYITGRAQRIELDTRYKVLERNSYWSLVQEVGAHARFGMFSDGIKAFVSVRERPDGNRVFTIGRSSPFVPFPVQKFQERLNEAEDRTDGDLWGGGDNIIGSPRVSGSHQSVAGVSSVLRETIEDQERILG